MSEKVTQCPDCVRKDGKGGCPSVDFLVKGHQSLKEEIITLSHKIDQVWASCDYAEHRSLTNTLRELCRG